MKLSANFTLAEAIRSDTAKRLGINNKPTAEHLQNLKVFSEKVLQKVRDYFGVSIYTSSIYRSKLLNKAIKGSSSSQHCTGEAGDIDMDGSDDDVTNKMVFDYIKDHLEFDQLIWEFGDKNNPDWVHVSYKAKGNQRKQVLRAVKIKGKTAYQKYE